MDRVSRLARWTLPPIGGVALLCILYILVIRSPQFLGDSDTGWHIRTGDFIRQTGTIPRHDVFSFTMPGRDWFAWEWLTDVAMSMIHDVYGLPGITRAALIILFLGYALLLRVALARGSDIFVASGLTIFAAWVSMLHWLARPHILSILLMICWCVLVENWKRHRLTQNPRAKLIYALPLLVALWANVHGAFVVTFPMLAIYAAGETLEFARRREVSTRKFREILRTYLIAGLTSAAASLATPYGFRLYGHLWQYVTDSELLASIHEFQSPNFHNVAGKSIEVLLFLAAVALVRAVLLGRYVEIGVLLFWAHLMLQSVRHVPLAAVVIIPIISVHWSDLLREFANTFETNRLLGILRRRHQGFKDLDRHLNGSLIYLAMAVFLVVLMSGSSSRLNALTDGSFDEGRLPVAASDFIADSRPSGNLYASDQFGGYLIYRFYPEIKVFIDGRSDFYETGGVVGDYLKIASIKPEWASLLDKYKVGWMLLRPHEALATLAQSTGRWVSVYEDGAAQVLIRR